LNDQALRYWIGFNRINGIGAVRMNALITYFSDLEQAWRAPESALMTVLNDRRACASVLQMRQTIDLDADLNTLRKIGARAITLLDDDYPPLLRQISAPPPVLYVKSDLLEADQRALAIVGTRSPTAYGVKAARGLAHALVKAGWTVVSGLAKGIDAAAHSTAIRYGGRTIALLGHGIDQIYPADHDALAAQISKQGALISEYPLGTPPEGRNFPARNRLISGLSRGVIVVEASLRSGALTTVNHALDQGREAFAVPGPIQSPESAGTHLLIQKGHAKLITSIADLWSEFEPGLLTSPAPIIVTEPEAKVKRSKANRSGGDVQKPRKATTAAKAAVSLIDLAEASTSPPTLTASDLSGLEGIDAQAISVWSHLRAQPLRIDDLCADTGLTIAQITSALTMLELQGLVRQNSGLIYAISELE
jgi:DNA processing protein